MINTLVDAWDIQASNIISYAVFKLMPTDPKPVLRDIIKEVVVSEMSIEKVANPDFIQKYEQLQAHMLELNKLMSETKVKQVQITEDLKNLPSWVESGYQIRNNCLRGFDDDREEAKWERKKTDLISNFPEAKDVFDVWKRDREVTKEISKRQKSLIAIGRDYTMEMVECSSRLGLEHPRESIRLVRKEPRESEPPQPREDANDVSILEKCYEISGVDTLEELLELLTII